MGVFEKCYLSRVPRCDVKLCDVNDTVALLIERSVFDDLTVDIVFRLLCYATVVIGNARLCLCYMKSVSLLGFLTGYGPKHRNRNTYDCTKCIRATTQYTDVMWNGMVIPMK